MEITRRLALNIKQAIDLVAFVNRARFVFICDVCELEKNKLHVRASSELHVQSYHQVMGALLQLTARTLADTLAAFVSRRFKHSSIVIDIVI